MSEAIDRRCYVLPDNALIDAAISGGNWTASPDNLTIGNLVQDVARCSTGLLADATFTASWAGKARTIGAVALIGYTGPAAGRVRLIFRRGGVEVLRTRWDWLWPRIAKTADLTPDHPGWLTGRPATKERALYTHIWLWTPPARLRADAMTVEIDARGGSFDLSYCFAAGLHRPAWPMGWGRKLDQTDATPQATTLGGMVITGARLPAQRSQAVTFFELTKTEAMRWLDISRGRRAIEPVLFVPDPGDPANWMREVFLATFDGLLGFEENDVDRYEVGVKFKEIIA